MAPVAFAVNIMSKYAGFALKKLRTLFLTKLMRAAVIVDGVDAECGLPTMLAQVRSCATFITYD
jgi:hypothetical protein